MWSKKKESATKRYTLKHAPIQVYKSNYLKMHIADPVVLLQPSGNYIYDLALLQPSGN